MLAPNFNIRLALAAVFLLTIVVYRPIWSAEWVYEDSNAVMANAAVTGQTPIAIDRGRWVSALSHRLVYRAFGSGPRAPHLVNLGLHLLNGGLVYAIGLVFLPAVAAWLAAALFLLHPLQTEAVAYVASRSELLATTWALIALWYALQAPTWWRQCVMWIAVAVAVCAKESAVIVVPLIVLADVFRGRAISRWRLAALIVPVGLIAYTVLRFDYRATAEVGAVDYAAFQATALWRYLLLAVLPIGQTVDHDFDLVPVEVRALALVGAWGLLMIPLLLSLDVQDVETKRDYRLWESSPLLKVLAFGLAWLMVSLGPRFVMRIPELLNEHQTYFPFIGVWMAVSAVLTSEGATWPRTNP